jgi:hypothetical protein
MTRSGVAYPLPPWEHPTDGSASSSLLKTPTAQLAQNGGSQHPDKRRQGGHGPTLADEIEHLLPTPMANMHGPSQREIDEGNPKHRLETAVALLPTLRATDGTNGGPNQRGSSGDLMLPSAVHLLPTPCANDGKGAGPLGRRPMGDDDLATRVERLLPTPKATNNENRQSLDRYGPNLGMAIQDLTGASTGQPSTAGLPSSTAPHLPRPWWELVADEF